MVLSILLALAVDEWRGDVADRAAEREYLVRLVADIDANLELIERQHGNQQSQLSSARLIYPLVSRGDWEGLDTAIVVRAAYLATPSSSPTWVSHTFRELSSTGRMVLIRSSNLRAELLSYYGYLDAEDYVYELMSTKYRDAVRSRMDPDLQLKLRAECNPRDFRCPVAVSAPDLDQFVAWISSNVELADGLRRVIIQWARADDEFLPRVEQRSRALRTLLVAEAS